MIILLAVTLFLSSTLLFFVQPMIAKMVLPLLGGTPAVWNTCMMFFQATLLLRWFARTDHPSAQDPYFRSVAGNVGSVVALVAYPVVVEPTLRLADQSWMWAGAYALFVALTVACHYLVYRAARGRERSVD